MDTHPHPFDVCMICALPEEARALLDVVRPYCDGAIEEHSSSRYQYSYRAATITNRQSEPLTLHISWLPRYGPAEMTLHLSRILEECQPRLAVMTGICAGDAGQVQLGDIVVAERTFTYDSGKFTRDARGRQVHLHDTLTYQLDAAILQFLGLFDDWKPLVAALPHPSASPETTPEGREVRCHLKAMASGSAVRADHPFRDVRVPVRGTAAIDMEGAAFALATSRHHHTPWLVVKGVCDYADQQKNDMYHDYAARASATYALSFLQSYVTNERLPRRGGPSPASRTDLPHFWNVPYPRNPFFTGRETGAEKMEQQESTIEIFCCYAHEDEHLLSELKTHLSALQRQQLVNVWHDRDISAGAVWEQEIERHLSNASIILLLISPDFIFSEYCYGTELKRALELHKRGEARVIPVLLRLVNGWEKIPPGEVQLGQLQALPKEAKPITRWTNRDKAWEDVAEGISRVVSELTQFNRQKQRALDKVKKLIPGVDVSLYQDTFGRPTFINRKSPFINPNDALRKFIEYVFVDEYFYLDVIADDEGKVLYFAVTIRDKSFNPIFKNQVFQVQLGISKYSDIPGNPRSAQGCLGANWFAYYETKYFGRPGAYQDFGFGLNTAGYYPASSRDAYRGLVDTMHNCQGTLSDKEIEAVRASSADEVFNTYAVSAPGIWITDYAHLILGVNYDQVRILNP